MCGIIISQIGEGPQVFTITFTTRHIMTNYNSRFYSKTSQPPENNGEGVWESNPPQTLPMPADWI